MAGDAPKGCPPLEKLAEQFADGGGAVAVPVPRQRRDLGEAEKVRNAKVAGATPVFEWAGNDTMVFSY
jgi:hypothetical protein